MTDTNLKNLTQYALTSLLGQRLSKFEHIELIESGYFNDTIDTFEYHLRRDMENTKKLESAVKKMKKDKTKHTKQKNEAAKKEKEYRILKMTEEEQLEEVKKYFIGLDVFEKKKFFMRNVIKGSEKEIETQKEPEIHEVGTL